MPRRPATLEFLVTSSEHAPTFFTLSLLLADKFTESLRPSSSHHRSIDRSICATSRSLLNADAPSNAVRVLPRASHPGNLVRARALRLLDRYPRGGTRVPRKMFRFGCAGQQSPAESLSPSVSRASRRRSKFAIYDARVVLDERKSFTSRSAHPLLRPERFDAVGKTRKIRGRKNAARAFLAARRALLSSSTREVESIGDHEEGIRPERTDRWSFTSSRGLEPRVPRSSITFVESILHPRQRASTRGVDYEFRFRLGQRSARRAVRASSRGYAPSARGRTRRQRALRCRRSRSITHVESATTSTCQSLGARTAPEIK